MFINQNTTPIKKALLTMTCLALLVPALATAERFGPPPPPPPPPPAQPKPNLFSQFPSPCDSTLVRVLVCNNGKAAAGPSSLKMEFLTRYGWVTKTQYTPSLAPGGAATLTIVPPAGFSPWICGGKYQYRVIVDHTGVVNESNESDNTKATLCY